MAKLTERKIQYHIWDKFNKTAWLMPNYTPAYWYEADVWAWYKSGRTAEFEIKITKADFLADLKKGIKEGSEDSKHRGLALGAPHGPNRFFYVVPEVLVEDIKDLVPHYAGLISICMSGGRYRVQELKKAPLLHEEKSERPVLKTNVSLYYRYWQERGKDRGDVEPPKPTEEPAVLSGIGIEQLAKVAGVISSMNQLMVLYLLWQRGPMTITQIGELCKVKLETIRSAALKLGKDGLLEIDKAGNEILCRPSDTGSELFK